MTRDERGDLHARLLDAVEGRWGTVYADWLKDEGLEVIVTVEHTALDPSSQLHGYANAIRDELPDAVAVLDAFHVGTSARPRWTRSAGGSNRDLAPTRT